MPVAAPSGISNRRSTQRTLLTPSASPSVGPPDHPPTKRPRLRSTPSSVISTTPSTSTDSTSSVDVNSARRASTLRVLNVWTQLAERYNKRLDEDDIVDLYSGIIIKDRGVLKGASKDYQFGHIAQPDSEPDYPDGDQDPEDSEQDEDDNDINALPPSEATTDDDAPISKKELLRGVPPLSATTDTEDLREFLEAEKKRRELAGDEEDEEEMSPEQLSALRKALEEHAREREAVAAAPSQQVVGALEEPLEAAVDTTPTRPSICVPPSEDESEDELAVWQHDESTAIYPVARNDSEQDVLEVEQEVIDLADSDSDAEFEALLIRPPRYNRPSPLLASHPEEKKPLQSPPDSEIEKPKSRGRPRRKVKSTEVERKSESRAHSPLARRKPEIIPAHNKQPSKTNTTISGDAGSDQEAVRHISPSYKGKGKEIPPLMVNSHREKAPESLGPTPRGRKRKRIVSPTSGDPSAQSPAEVKSNLRNRRKSTSQNSITPTRPGSTTATLKDVSSPVAGPSRSVSAFPSASVTQQPTPSISAYGSLEPDSTQPMSHDRETSSAPFSSLPPPIAYPYSLRHPSQPPPIFSSPGRGTPGLSLPVHPPPPIDPVQAQQAQYLLAQAMHQLSYIISATMPSYTYPPNPSQPWNHLPPPYPPHAAYSTPIQPPHFHGTRPYHTPSSSISSGLPPSSPTQSPITPSVEELRARSRGRSKTRGRRVSFKFSNEEVVSREHSVAPELHYTSPKNRKQSVEVKREKGKGKSTEESDDSSRIEDRDSPPREAARGRTPGPRSRQKSEGTRGRSLTRR